MASERRVRKVQSDPDEIISFDAVEGDGVEGEHHDQLRAIASDAAAAPRSPGIIAATHVAVDIAEILRISMKTIDAQYEALSSPTSKAMLDVAQKAVTSRMPTSGWDSPEGYQAAMSAERGKLSLQQQTAAADMAQERFRSKADAAIQQLAEDVAAARTAIETEVIDFEGLESLREPLELVDLQRIASGVEEVNAKGSDAMPFLLRQVEAAIRLDLPELKLLRAVATKCANKVLATPLSKQKAEEASHDNGLRWVGGIHDVTSQDVARKVLKLLADEKESRRPESIATAIDLLRRSLTVFVALAGRSADDLATAMYVDRPLLQNDPLHWQKVDVLKLTDPDFLKRFLRPSALTLSGWSPVIIPATKDKDGRYTSAPVRQPAPKARAS